MDGGADTLEKEVDFDVKGLVELKDILINISEACSMHIVAHYQNALVGSMTVYTSMAIVF